MGTAKTEDFSIRQNKLARYLKAMAHPARIAILEILIRKQACVCGELVDDLPLAQSTVSQHLKELKEAGLIKGEIEGPSICYCINEAEWGEARKYFEHLFNSYMPNKKCC